MSKINPSTPLRIDTEPRQRRGERINVAVIGIGHLGSKHLRVLSELKDKVNIIGICDLNLRRTKKFADHYRVKFFRNYRDLMGLVDAVDICVPTSLHYSVAKDFLEKDIHTFIEKPIASSAEEAEKLAVLSEKRNLKLQVGHVERFNSAFLAIQKLAKNPHFVECHRLNHFPNRSLDIGVVMDLMIHDIDIVLDLVKSPVKSVDAVGALVLSKTEDIANARIRFKNNTVCNLTASRVIADPQRRIRIFQDKAYISLDYVSQEAHIFTKENGHIQHKRIDITKSDSLKEELDHFIDCVRSKKKPLVSGEEGRAALALALQISKQIHSQLL